MVSRIPVDSFTHKNNPYEYFKYVSEIKYSDSLYVVETFAFKCKRNIVLFEKIMNYKEIQ